jgi:hypothetical protein
MQPRKLLLQGLYAALLGAACLDPGHQLELGGQQPSEAGRTTQRQARGIGQIGDVSIAGSTGERTTELIREIGVQLEQLPADAAAVGRGQDAACPVHIEQPVIEGAGADLEAELGADVGWTSPGKENGAAEAVHVGNAVAHQLIDGVGDLHHVGLEPVANESFSMPHSAPVDQHCREDKGRSPSLATLE